MDAFAYLDTLHRPRLLLRAARIGADDYRRAQHLRRLLGTARPPSSAEALRALIALEEDLDSRRRAEDGSYSLTRHVDLLIAMMGEARLIRATLPRSA